MMWLGNLLIWLGCGIFSYLLIKFVIRNLNHKMECIMKKDNNLEKKPWTRRRATIYFIVCLLTGMLSLQLVFGMICGFFIFYIIYSIHRSIKNIDLNKDTWWNKKTRL